MSFIIRNPTAGVVLIDDLGIEIAAGELYDMLQEPAADVQASGQVGGGLNASITAGDLIVVDPRDGATDLIPADGLIVVQQANNPNWGILGGRINDLDDVNMAGAITGDVLQLGGSGTFTVVTPSALAGDIALGDLSDVTDATSKLVSEFYIFQGDGTNAVLTSGAGNTLFKEFIEDTSGAVIADGNQTDVTVIYVPATNTIDISVDDNFLRNTGDVLDSGTLNIASGASLVIATGATATMADAPVNVNDLANKAYVDSVAQGTDNKDSVVAATTPASGDIGGTYAPTGGTGGSGAFTGILTDIVDGLTLVDGDRVIIKDQTDPLQNGIYVALNVIAATSMDLERSVDMDGTPASEVSPGNLAFISGGNTNANTSWIVTGTIDPIILNTDPVNWTQFSGSGSFTAGAGLGLNGTEFFLNVNNLTGINAVAFDELAFNDITDNTTKKRSFANIITDLGIFTDGNLTASDGILITAGGDIQLDITGLPTTPAPTLNAEMVFDENGSGTHSKGTVANFFNGLDVVHGITVDGMIARTADDTYASRTLTPSLIPADLGISIVDGDGIAGNPTIGLNIIGLTASSNIMSSTDEMMMYGGASNEKITGQQMADGVAAILGGLGEAYTTIVGDTGTAIASSATDTLAFTTAVSGGIVTVVTDSAPDTVTFAVDVGGLAVGGNTVDLTDKLIVGDALGTSTVSYTFQDVVTDLDIVTGLGALTGLIVSDGAGNYTATTIAVNGAGNQDGLVVTNADGVAGSPTIGLDIINTPLAAENLAATDRVIAYNASGSVNEGFTGQEVADGVGTILGFGGLAVSTINAQEVLTLVDTTRANKILSVGDTSVTWAENRLGNNDWMQIGSAVDAQSGYIIPLDATIVKVTAHTSNNKGNTKSMILYIDGAAFGTIGSFSGAAGPDEIIDPTLDIDVIQGAKLRIRAGAGGRIEDTVFTLWLKWRG